MPRQKLSLTGKFAVYSLLAIAAIGLTIGIFLTNQLRSQLFNDYVARALAIQRAVVSHHIMASDFQPGNRRLAGKDFDTFIKRDVLSRDLKRIKIWDRDGRILYAIDRRAIGRQIRPSTNLAKALAGKPAFKEERPREDPDAPLLLELYSPIRIKGKVVGAYEASFALGPLRARQRTMIFSVISLLAGGLGLLWLSLYGLVRSASTTIERQNIGLQRLSDNLSHSLDKLLKNYMGTMESLAGAVEARDPYTGGHSHRVESLSMAMSRQLKLSQNQALRLERAGELHDIGKIGIPETVLAKPTTLNPDEWEVMKRHPVLGAELIERVPFLRDIAPIVRHHHERFDGRGYPDGLAGDAIPMEARVLSVIDAFDAMISRRPYRDAQTPAEALRQLRKGSGTQFDPAVVEAFLALRERRQDLFKDLEAA